MKTSKFSKAAGAMLLLLMLCGYSAYAQNEKSPKQDSVCHKIVCGIGISESISNNGFGLNTSPYVMIRYKSNSLSVGPTSQTVRNNISGIRCSYEYLFDTVPYLRNVDAFLHATIVYDMAAYLNNKAVRSEYQFAENYTGENVNGIENWKFKTLEYYAGFGFRKAISTFEISASVGVGGYHTTHNPALWDGWLHRERTNTIVQLQTSVVYKF